MATPPRCHGEDQPAGECNGVSGAQPQAKKKKKARTSLLPEELMREVRLRLPARTLARLRCVSRAWDADITSPGFVDRHHALALATPKLAFVPLGPAHRFLANLFGTGLDERAVMGCAGCPRLVAPKACRGLVLVERCGGGGDDDGKSFTVCNPSTGGAMELPAVRTLTNPLAVVNLAGIGFVESAPAGEEYKVVMQLRQEIPLVGLPGQMIKPEPYGVITLGVDRGWRFRRVPSHVTALHGGATIDGHPAFADGCLHWTYRYQSLSVNGDINETRGILSFSLADESFRQVPLPAAILLTREASGGAVVLQAELGGKLCLVRSGVPGQLLQIWKLEDGHDAAGSWSLDYLVDLPPAGRLPTTTTQHKPLTNQIAVALEYLSSSSSSGGGGGEKRELLLATTHQKVIAYSPCTNTFRIVASPAAAGGCNDEGGGGDDLPQRTDSVSLVLYQESLVRFDGMRYGGAGVDFVNLGVPHGY